MRIVAIFAAMGAAAAGFVPAASPGPTASILAVRYGDNPPTLLRVDARTLAPLDGPTLSLDRRWGARAFSPDGAQLAMATNEAPALTLVATATLQVSWQLPLAATGYVNGVFWPAPNRLFALVSSVPDHTEVVVLDPVTRIVVTRTLVHGNLWTAAGTRAGPVYLVGPDQGIGTAQVVAVDFDGRARRVDLERIRVGTKWRRVRGVRVANIRQPGFAVDPAGRKAFVLDASGLVAAVDLDASTVTYHVAASARRLARTAKSITGPMLSARWLGDRKIAVTGTNARMRVTKTGAAVQTWKPAGVAVIDTGAWTSRMLARDANSFAAAPGTIVVPQGKRAVTGYDADGAVRFSVPLGEDLAYVQVAGGYAYAWGRERTTTVVDWASGEVVATVPKQNLALIGD